MLPQAVYGFPDAFGDGRVNDVLFSPGKDEHDVQMKTLVMQALSEGMPLQSPGFQDAAPDPVAVHGVAEFPLGYGERDLYRDLPPLRKELIVDAQRIGEKVP